MIEDLIQDRLKKLHTYEQDASPYPARVRRDVTLKELRTEFQKLSRKKKNLYVVGRVWSIRDQGSIIFIDIQDASGSMQLLISKAETKKFNLIKKTLDRGDFIEAYGFPVRTKRGEKSVSVKRVRIIAKSIRPLPATWYGLEDTEVRLRERYLDILLNPETRELFAKKIRFWDTIRSFLKEEGFFEVEMPVLESVPGGAEAEPFVTHHKALDKDFYLRISLELPLKKMLVGGVEKVFEIGRIFRNEGIDQEHLQDYTQMECYAAYWDYTAMMKFTERLYKRTIKKTLGTLTMNTRGHKISWGSRWSRVDYYEVFKRKTGIDLVHTTIAELKKKARSLGITVARGYGKGRIIDLIYKHSVRGTLIQPCFLIDPPVEIEPLAKRRDDDPGRVERFQIVAAGTELGKGFSELNDPIDQRKRFEEQMKLREQGDVEAQRIDEDFLKALEYGMPPAGGFGMSERLFAVLLDKPIRETVIFPLMRKKTDA